MKEKNQALLLYIILTGIFISCLVTCNLIFLKFFSIKINFLNLTFNQSVGLIAYPVTFLITDVISEVYGQKKANFVVISGIISSIIILGIMYLAEIAPADLNSPVDNETFSLVFGEFGIAMAASLFTYLVCQLIDIRIFHFWKKLTHGKHLWLRNNLSTIFSQLIDTFLILFLLMTLTGYPENWPALKKLFINGFLFKMTVALIDTPIIYIFVITIRKKFNLNVGEEIKL
tara:strand:+ start:877 stop:1566 length:690 start_codon:yes stop_codon:yes gene_type:complete